MTVNGDLHKAKTQKYDEFYTQLTDIEDELRHYKHHFKGKVVYCNCDDPIASNFFRFFQLKFRQLGLKKLITTCYKNRNPDIFSKHTCDKAVGMVISEQEGDTADLPSIEMFDLEGDGDFRSSECVELLKQADIVVTNPPFSLFREYVAQLVKYDKRFVIVGNQNAITYKEIFPLIQAGKVWLGINNGGTKWFQVNPNYEIKTESRQKWENGKKYFSMGNVNWFTNLDYPKRHEDIRLYRKYSEDEYPTYDNYDAINVDRYKDIPKDWGGAMGVPITFLDKHNPDQFEIVKFRKGDDDKDLTVDGKPTYFRIVIRNRRLAA